MFKKLLIIGIIFLAACEPSTIRVKNSISKAVVKNVEWGGVPISSNLLPGETSTKIKIFNHSYYDIDLPESHPLRFYMDLNGDMVYLETKESFKLAKDDDLTIELDDQTEVFNPALDNG